MSLAADRARVIAESIRRDGWSRRVFVLPRPPFLRCRVVAIPLHWEGWLLRLRNEGAVDLGYFRRGAEPREIEEAIDEALDSFHMEPPNSLIDGKHQGVT